MDPLDFDTLRRVLAQAMSTTASMQTACYLERCDSDWDKCAGLRRSKDQEI